MTESNKKILLIGFGNPARADDGLGPALAEEIESKNIPDVTVEADYQLTIEDSAQVAEHDIVIFADASANAAEPFSFEPLTAKESRKFFNHSVEPARYYGSCRKSFRLEGKRIYSRHSRL